MDRRALLAIMISALLISVWQIVFFPAPPPEEEHAVVDGRVPPPPSAEIGALERPADPPDQIIGDAAEIGSAAVVVEDVPAKIVSVSTPLYRLEIDTRGGVIRAIDLLQFDHRDGGPVSLAGPQDAPGLGLLLNTSDGQRDLRRTVFACNDNDIRIVDPGQTSSVVLEQTLPDGITVRREFTFRGDSYRFDVHQKIGRMAAAPEIFSYHVLWEPGVAFTEGGPDHEKDALEAVTMLGTEVVRDKGHKVKEEGVDRSGSMQWTGVKGKYFAVVLIPVEEPGGDVKIRRLGEEGHTWFDTKFPVRSPAGSEQTFGLYAGPIDYDLLAAEGIGLEGLVDLGWSLIRPVSRLMLHAMVFLYKFVPNYGWVIVIISVLTKLLFYRLTHKSFQSMKDMQAIQGEVTALREKYKSDSQRMNKEVWALYKREGVNPMGGCFPMLLQMPVFIALYSVLRSTIGLRQAPWLFWVNDLSRQEVLFELPVPLPILGTAFSLLPILMGISMFLQQKMTTVDPRQKAMIYIMPVMFTVMFYRLPSGLVLYWLVNNVLSIAQQWLIHRGSGGKPATVVVDGNDNKSTGAQPRSTTRSKKGKGRKSLPPAKETS